MTSLDVLGIGNAIVDTISRADDDLLVASGLNKGSMALVDEARAAALYEKMGPTTVISGGSAANTMAGLASLGARAGFVGKVKNDDAGREFTHDIRKAGVAFDTPPAADGAATARCLIFVTPDGQRTMNTFLGACQALAPEDIDEARVADAKVLYMEGYLWDPPGAKEAFLKAAKVSRAKGRKVALTLSDSFCVDRYRGEFLSLIRDRVVDIVFANESELHALYETADFETAIAALRAEKDLLGVVTRSEKGCIVADSANLLSAPAFPVEEVVDTTGAGDLFAAGFLAGYTRGLPHERSAALGALAAAEIISHVGARPQKDLLQLARDNGVLA
ncbi:adenosine kinase [Methylocystis sp. WRRC1]|uniref:adenosine kinase n=1 Tax=unclassified Methylocystis TaxID=2625913 RepID=UPI0001F87FD0|nr:MULTISPECIES: adenosine kinase [unclassified Methylocystis]MCC3245929.1 adenosine kinase [Methylocystis sp. WRRC1]